MRTELRFLVAISLMILVLVGTNLMFPAVQPEGVEPVDSASAEFQGAFPEGAEAAQAAGETAAPVPSVDTGSSERADEVAGEVAAGRPEDPGAGAAPQAGSGAQPESLIHVESPLYDFVFSTHGARMVEAHLLTFASGVTDGPVQLLPEGGPGVLGQRFLSGGDTLDYRGLPFQVSPENGLVLREDSGPASLTFTFPGTVDLPRLELVYTFSPDFYAVLVEGRMDGSGAGVLFTDLGVGLTFNEARPQDEERAMAYVFNQVQDGITTEAIREFETMRLEPGPHHWVSFKSKYFVLGLLAGAEPDSEEGRFGGVIALPTGAPFTANLTVTQPVGDRAGFSYRLFAGPQDYQRLKTLGQDFQSVNVYGWRLFRPIIRPFSGIITTILVFLHKNLSIGYGWVLIIFGLIMRIVLFPLNHKAMKAQVRNMAVQPLLQEAQTKYKNDPERMQKELMKLYKEHGFNPVAGCLPMLLPWPVLIALFFVFQNTIELRGVPFLWIPDLSAADPLYILPIILAISMFLIQWISLRTMETPNAQMKTMMWMMPIFMLFIFSNLASGLNLYYATANIATLPQQYWIAGERKRAQEKMKVHVGTTKDASKGGKKG